MKQVFFDDYRDLEVGVFPQDYSALGEYHFQLPQGKTGKWTATTVHHSWRGNPSWIINTENGKRVVEQACIRDRFIPMLVAGQEWDNVVIKTAFRPLSLVGGFGILFRYQTSRAYYALWFENATLELVLCADEKREVLATCPAAFDCDSYFPVEIRTTGNQLIAQVGEYVLTAQDETYPKGRVGFAATHPVRFGAFEVLMEEKALDRHIALRQEFNHKLEQKKAIYPQFLLSKKILTPKYGVGKSIRFGDLNQDGRKEMLLAQNVRRMRGDNFSEISCLTAIDLDGNVLWQVGEPNPDNALVSNDLPVQIHDIDGDGKLEVIYCKDFMIRVLDGKTGQLKYEAPTPVAPPHKGPKMVETQYYRITGDSLYFCDLTNQGADRDLIIKDRYNNIWAYTWDLQLLWHYQGNCGHYPMACDIDGDGKDEILIGYTLLDHDGTVLWSLDIGDHADGVAIG